MNDLSNWDFADEFTGQQAAALIVGLDPSVDSLKTAEPVLTSMERCYNSTLTAHKLDQWRTEVEKNHEDWIPIPSEEEPFSARNLHCWRMDSYYEQWYFGEPVTKMQIALAELSEDSFRSWLTADVRTDFDQQFFLRSELARWTHAIQKTSIYHFELRGRLSVSGDARSAGTVHQSSERRDLLKPVIELAQLECRNPWDAWEVWAKLRGFAQSKHAPLIGTDDTGIQYLDANEQLKILSLKALRMRLFRAR